MKKFFSIIFAFTAITITSCNTNGSGLYGQPALADVRMTPPENPPVILEIAADYKSVTLGITNSLGVVVKRIPNFKCVIPAPIGPYGPLIGVGLNAVQGDGVKVTPPTKPADIESNGTASGSNPNPSEKSAWIAEVSWSVAQLTNGQYSCTMNAPQIRKVSGNLINYNPINWVNVVWYEGWYYQCTVTPLYDQFTKQTTYDIAL